MSKVELDEEQKKALVDAISCLSELKEYELFPVSGKTIDALTDLLGFVPQKKKEDDDVIKTLPSFLSEGTIGDNIMHGERV